MSYIKIFFLALVIFCLPEIVLASSCEDFNKALEVASNLRGLKILKPVACEVVDKKKFAALMQETYLQNITTTKLELEELASKMTGLIPQEYDYSKCYFENNLESVLASYFPNHKTVYIPSEVETTFDLLVHEATHALQDQHFDLGNKSKLSSYSTDASFAFLALAEGDAELIQLQYLKSQQNKKRISAEQSHQANKNSCELPQSLLFQLDFPYFWGARYARTLTAIDPAFAKYPKFTTEVLYPGKSFNFRKPTLKETFNLAKSQFSNQAIEAKPVYEDSWGEYTLRCLLREIIGSRASVIAGYGWNGDRIALYQFKNSPDQHALTWVFNMRHPTDAIELFKAFKLSLERRFKLTFNTDADTILFGNDTYSKIFLKRRNDKVELLVSNQKL